VALGVLGVVIPVYNEGDWIRRSLAALRVAATRASWPLEIVVVDDGSTDETVAILDGLAEGIHLVRQEKQGRFAARLAGRRALRARYVLLLDSRVLLDPDALVTLKARVTEDESSAWNAHVNVATAGNPWAAFWSGLTKVGWRRYFANPRRVSFGPTDFNAYPKGTGAFAAPTQVILAAAAGFSSLFADQRLASDDTKLLRNVAAATPINIDPGFSCLYFGRDSFQRWARQSYFRGTTFVDGYVGTRRNAALVLAGVAALGVTGGWLAIRRPAVVGGLAAAGVAGAAAATRLSGGDGRETTAVAGLLVPFAAVFGAGFVRGLVLALRS